MNPPIHVSLVWGVVKGKWIRRFTGSYSWTVSQDKHYPDAIGFTLYLGPVGLVFYFDKERITNE